jgi:hypothetical protein
MPEMDGIELARRATELDPDLKVMFITGFAAVALNPDSHAPKDAKVLSKPFHLRISSPRSRSCWRPEPRAFPGPLEPPALSLLYGFRSPATGQKGA